MTKLEIKEELWLTWCSEDWCGGSKEDFFSDLDRVAEAAIKDFWGVKGENAKISFIGMKQEGCDDEVK